jgi:glycosyltransferase involved in cell wall biosynthesis
MQTSSSQDDMPVPETMTDTIPSAPTPKSRQNRAVRDGNSELPPKVSIGMPVYNAESYLREAVESLLAQTFTDYEIIISDNASTDQTEAICRAYAKADSRISYVRQSENLGATGNFNHVFGLARGPYFKWASYDDVCEPDFLAKCVEVLESRPEIVWVHSASSKINEHGDVIDSTAPEAEGIGHTSEAGLPRRFFDSPSPHQRFQGVLLGTNWCVDSYGLIRADALRATQLLPACYGSEKVLMGALSLAGCYHEIPETLFYQRVHAAASSRIENAADQLTFMDTKATSRFASTRVRLLLGHLDSISDSSLPAWQKFRCLLIIGKYLLQTNKWSSVVRNTVTGTGVGRTRTNPERSGTTQ